MLFTDHELAEFARFAGSAYAQGHNAVGHKFSVLAATAKGEWYSPSMFDGYMAEYRAWLVFDVFAA